MLKKLMAKFGVGAAIVDLRLDQPSFRLGETMTGTIHIEGGSVEQRISELSVLLLMKTYINGQEITRPVQSIPVLKGFAVQPKPFVQDIPFTFQIPASLAVSTPSLQYFLHTKLDVEMSLDPTDLDYVQILPPKRIEKVIEALLRNDFRQKPDSGKLTPYGQEFSFFPGRPMGVPLNELEVIFFDTPEELRMLVELDIAVPGLFSREKEHKVEIVVTNDLLEDGREEALARYLMEKIEGFANNPQTIPYVSMATYQQGYHGHHGHGMGGMIGGMAAGLLGGLLLGELMSEAAESAGDLFDDEGGDDGGFDFGFGDDEL
ncbi:sporulation protein [Brevibacillus sp. H7]|uniref:sporulation protein n=1 Tax=Brevibacillus sp. H7 TaxID=3349138 RepID=UPI003803664C